MSVNYDPSAGLNECREHFWTLAGANYNVLAMINAKGHLAERYEYTPYPRKCGERQVYRYNPWKGVRGDMDGDGNVDSFDTSPFTTATSDMASYHTSYPDLDGHARADLNDDGAVDSFDIALFNAFLAGERDELESAPTLRSYRNGKGMTLNDIGHQGLMHDEELSLIHNRARTLHPAMGRFMQRDPLGYVDGMNWYLDRHAAPIDMLDQAGTVGTKRTEVDLGRGFVAGIDPMKRPGGVLDFHMHIQQNKVEVAMVRSDGVYRERHGGNPLKKPSELPRDVRRNIRRTLREQSRDLAKRAGKRVPIIGGIFILLTFSDDAEAHGVGGASGRAVPILGDVLTFGDDVRNFHGSLTDNNSIHLAAINYPVWYAHGKAGNTVYDWLQYERETRKCPCPDQSEITRCIDQFNQDLWRVYRSEISVSIQSRAFGLSSEINIQYHDNADITPAALSFQQCMDRACLIGDKWGTK